MQANISVIKIMNFNSLPLRRTEIVSERPGLVSQREQKPLLKTDKMVKIVLKNYGTIIQKKIV